MKDLYDEWISPAPIQEESIPVDSSRFCLKSLVGLWHKYQSQLLAALKSHPKK